MRQIRTDKPGGDESNADWTAGVEAVVAIRCMEHHAISPYNYNEGVGECAACQVEPLRDPHRWMKWCDEKVLDLYDRMAVQLKEIRAQQKEDYDSVTELFSCSQTGA